MYNEKLNELRKKYKELHNRYMDCLYDDKLDEAKELEHEIDETVRLMESLNDK